MKKISIFVLLVLLLSSIVFADIDDINDEIEKQEEYLEDFQKELDTLNSEHSDVSNERNTVIRNIRSLEDSVKNTEAEIQVLAGDIAANEVQVSIAEDELAVAIANLEHTNNLLDARIRVMYMNGTIGYFEVLLESRNFEDLLTRIEMLQRIVNSDTDLIAKMEEDKTQVELKKADLENEQVKLVSLQEEMQIKQQELKLRIAEFEEQKRALTSDMAALAISIEETEEEAEKITAILKDLELRKQYVGGAMAWPVPNKKVISSPFGMRIHPIAGVRKLHTGIDIPVNTGTSVVAAQNGVVIWSNWLGGYGKCVMIDHGGGIVTVYAHNSRLTVKKNQEVKIGEEIAKSGNTGNSTGPHVHFEVRVNGEYVDPLEEYLKAATEF
jgi:murein DD-endopeptidase MepM/ murein hydrolase activator NlpD